MTERGIKYDAGKVRLGLLPRRALAWMARVCEYGALKYREGNWVKLSDADQLAQLREACQRHCLAAFDSIEPETFDPESKLPHLAHAATNLLFLLHHETVQGKIGDAEKLTRDQAQVFARLAVLQALRDALPLRPTYTEREESPGYSSHLATLAFSPVHGPLQVSTSERRDLGPALDSHLRQLLAIPAELPAARFAWQGLAGAELKPDVLAELG